MVRDVKITVLDTTGVRTNSWTLLFREGGADKFLDLVISN